MAATRISKFLTADELAEPFAIDDRDENKMAVDVDGDFAWETVGKVVEKFEIPDTDGKMGPGGGGGRRRKEKKVKPKSAKKALWKRKSGKEEVLPTTADSDKKDGEREEKVKEEEKPFELKNLKMQILKGSFVAIVGRVGSGKVCDGAEWISMFTYSIHRAHCFKLSSGRCDALRVMWVTFTSHLMHRY